MARRSGRHQNENRKLQQDVLVENGKQWKSERWTETIMSGQADYDELGEIQRETLGFDGKFTFFYCSLLHRCVGDCVRPQERSLKQLLMVGPDCTFQNLFPENKTQNVCRASPNARKRRTCVRAKEPTLDSRRLHLQSLRTTAHERQTAHLITYERQN